MLIRKPKSEETEQIIQLLQASLGEGLLKKSTQIWNFKHVENPFGISPVLVAEDNGILVGVRALMQWRWQIGDKVWVSYRAVDTATHPDYQGKGIFTSLTLKALEEVQKTGESFVFNTPNDKSRPGYLKMGWLPVGKVNVALVPTVCYFLTYLFASKKKCNSITDSELDKICTKHNSDLTQKGCLFTPKSRPYLKWRYAENPLQEYIILSSSNWYIAMYVKKHTYFNELRVTEIIGELTGENLKEIRKAIIKQAFQKKCLLVTTADKNVFKLRLFGNYGPMLTFKSLTFSETFVQKALNIDTWYYSTGDLELF